MSAAFTTQMTFNWANDSSVPVVANKSASKSSTNFKPQPNSKSPSTMTGIHKSPVSGQKVNLGVPATAKPIEAITSKPISNRYSRRGRPEHVSDLLLVVLDRYGINADEFLATLHD
jgi:hypothetical protein